LAIFVSDTFTDTAATALTAHTGEVGATWTNQVGAGSTVISSSNRLRCNGAAHHYASGSPASADYDVQADFHCLTLTNVAGICGRSRTDVNTNYAATYNSTAATPCWELRKTITGANTILASYNETLTASQTYVCKLEMRGSTLKVYIDGVERCSSSDGDITAAGFAGIRNISGSAGNLTGVHLDNYSAEDAPASDVTVTHTAGDFVAATSTDTPMVTTSHTDSGTAAGTSSPTSSVSIGCSAGDATSGTGTHGSACSVGHSAGSTEAGQSSHAMSSGVGHSAGSAEAGQTSHTMSSSLSVSTTAVTHEQGTHTARVSLTVDHDDVLFESTTVTVTGGVAALGSTRLSTTAQAGTRLTVKASSNPLIAWRIATSTKLLVRTDD
jgi:hypothetical protein